MNQFLLHPYLSAVCTEFIVQQFIYKKVKNNKEKSQTDSKKKLGA